jgi:N-acetylglutamate synthase-like GNAT family acetyltransferase
LAKLFQRKSFFRNRPIRKKHRLWRSCLLADQNEMSNPHREPSIDASYQVSVHLAKWFQRRRFLEIDQSEEIIACGGHCCYCIRTRRTKLIEDYP